MGKSLVKPKFGAGIIFQRCLQRLRVGKGDHGIRRRMDQENGERSIAHSFRRRDIAHVDAKKNLGPQADEIGDGLVEQRYSEKLQSHVRQVGVARFGDDRFDLGSFLNGHQCHGAAHGKSPHAHFSDATRFEKLHGR